MTIFSGLKELLSWVLGNGGRNQCPPHDWIKPSPDVTRDSPYTKTCRRCRKMK